MEKESAAAPALRPAHTILPKGKRPVCCLFPFGKVLLRSARRALYGTRREEPGRGGQGEVKGERGNRGDAQKGVPPLSGRSTDGAG